MSKSKPSRLTAFVVFDESGAPVSISSVSAINAVTRAATISGRSLAGLDSGNYSVGNITFEAPDAA